MLPLSVGDRVYDIRNINNVSDKSSQCGTIVSITNSSVEMTKSSGEVLSLDREYVVSEIFIQTVPVL